MASARFIDTEKFKGVVMSIEKHLVEQTGVLKTIADNESTKIKTEKEAEESRKRKDALENSAGDKKNGFLGKVKGMLGVVNNNIPSMSRTIDIAAMALAAPYLYKFAKGFVEQIFGSISDAMDNGTFWDGLTSVFTSEFGAIVVGSAIFGPTRMLLGTFIATGILKAVEKGLNAVGFDVDIDEAAVAPIISLIANAMLTIAGAGVLKKMVGFAFRGAFKGITNLFGGKPAATPTTTVPETVKPTAVEPPVTKPPVAEVGANAGKLSAAEVAAARNVTVAELESTVANALKSGQSAEGLKVVGDSVRRSSGAFASSTEIAAAYDKIIAARPALPGPYVPESAMTGAGAAVESTLGRRLVGYALGTPGLALQLALTPSEIALDPQEAVDSWIRRQFETKGVSAIPEVQNFLKSDAGKTLREQFGGVYTEFNDLLDSDFADAYAKKLYNAPGNENKPKSTGLFYGDSNRIINGMMKNFTSDADGFALSPGVLQTKVDALRANALQDTSSAGPSTVVAGSGNTTVNRQGDNHNTSVTNIYGRDPSSSLYEGNSVPIGGR